MTDDAGGGAVVLLPVVLGTGTASSRPRCRQEALHAGVTPASSTLGGLALGMLVLAVVVADRLGRWVSTPVSDVAAAAGRCATATCRCGSSQRAPRSRRSASRSTVGGPGGRAARAEREQAADLSHRLATPVTALRLDVDQIDDPQVAERLAGTSTTWCGRSTRWWPTRADPSGPTSRAVRRSAGRA